MSAAVRIVRFDSNDNVPAGDLTFLHRELLPHSPVVALGRPFMESFYYRVLPLDGSIFGAVAYFDDRPVGFIVATEDSEGFMSRGTRRHWLRLGAIMAWSIVSRPSTITGIWETLGIIRDRGKCVRQETMAELLSLGVLSEYRTTAFVRDTGIRFGKELMDAAMTQLKSKGCRSVKSLVDKDNIEVKLLYRALGWKLQDTEPAGWRTPQVEFILPLEPGR